jgi:hypothetical protein
MHLSTIKYIVMKASIKLLFLLGLLSFLQTNSFATIRRVGFVNSVSPVNGLDYATFQLAHDAAVNGDTIQLYPSTIGSGNSFSGTVIKRLVILGPGYYYNTYNLPSAGIINAGLQILPGGISSCNFTIGLGSAGSRFSGINGLSLTTSNILDSLNDITITRCRTVSISYSNSGVCNNWIISQCINPAVTQSGYSGSFSGNRTITNLRIENCFGAYINYAASGPQSPVGINSGQILNCILGYGLGTTGTDYVYNGLAFNNSVFVVQNCIDLSSILPGSGVSNSIYINNLTNAAALNNPVSTNPGSAGNVFGITTAGNAIFVGYPTNTSGSTTLYSPDAAFQLSPTSIAKNAGIIPGTAAVTDCGIYGGTNPYKTSGLPPVPSFYKLNSPSSTATSSPYIMTFSVKSNN